MVGSRTLGGAPRSHADGTKPRCASYCPTTTTTESLGCCSWGELIMRKPHDSSAWRGHVAEHKYVLESRGFGVLYINPRIQACQLHRLSSDITKTHNLI